MKIAITGASGFIGGSLSRYLHERGHEVLGLVRPTSQTSSLRETGIRTQVCDVTDHNGLQATFQGIDVVFHLAALFNHPEASWDDYRTANVQGTQNVLEASLACKVGRVIHCSTVGVAVGTGKVPASELAPYSPPSWDKYETTKCEAEKAALDFHTRTQLPIIVIRPSQVYGPGDRGKAKFYKMVKKGIIVNPGDTLKHLIFIDDLCRAFELAMEKDEAVGEVFIIADQKAIALRDLIGFAAHELGVAPPKLYLPAIPITFACTVTEHLCNFLGKKPILFRRSMDFFTKSVQFDVHKADLKLDFKAGTGVREGVQKTVSWYRQMDLL